MYRAAFKVEFQPFKRLYSQLTFFNFLYNMVFVNQTYDMIINTKYSVSQKKSFAGVLCFILAG